MLLGPLHECYNIFHEAYLRGFCAFCIEIATWNLSTSVTTSHYVGLQEVSRGINDKVRVGVGEQFELSCRRKITDRPRACHVKPDIPPTARHGESWSVMPAVWP